MQGYLFWEAKLVIYIIIFLEVSNLKCSHEGQLRELDKSWGMLCLLYNNQNCLITGLPLQLSVWLELILTLYCVNITFKLQGTECSQSYIIYDVEMGFWARDSELHIFETSDAGI